MPLSKIEFQPGIVKDDTDLASEGGWIDADKVRFRRGRPEVIGGWEAALPDTFTGIARGAHAWVTLAGLRVYAFGCQAKLYAVIGNELRDITPSHSEGVLTNAFTTTNFLSTVVVNHPDHRLSPGMTATFSNASAVGGITISGTYAVVDVTSTDTYTISHSIAASSDATGSTADYVVTLPAGLADGTGGTGFGVSTYGTGTYGVGGNTSTRPRTWSLDNFGENLLANPSGYGLYEFQPELAYRELVTNGDMAASAGWASGTGWTIAAGVATKVAGVGSYLSQNLQAWGEGGRTYRVTFTATVSAGSVQFQINAGDPPAVINVGDASTAVTTTGTYSRIFRMPALPVDLVFYGDSTFAGTIDNVSITLEDVAYRVDEAPFTIDSMFVDPNGIVVALGTEDETGIYSPLFVRGSDIQDNRSWLTDTSNLAHSFALASGGRIVGGRASRQQNLIWTDDGLYSMTFTGSTGDVYRYALLGRGCGLVGPNAMAEVNGLAFWWSNNGNFYSFNGSIPVPIDCGLRRDVMDNLADFQGDKIFCGVNSAFSEIWWLYPDSRDGLECSRYAALSWAESPAATHPIWTCGTLARSAWIKPGIFSEPLAFGTDSRVYWHEKGNDANGDVLTASLTSSMFDIEDGGNMMVLKRLVPDFDSQTGAINVTVTTRSFPNASDVTFGPYLATPSTTMLNMRVTARQMQLQFGSAASPSFWRLGQLRVDVSKSGALR